jgi:uncharacterized protein
MSLATARKIVDFAFKIAPPGKTIEFAFLGGEPLLCFDLMRSATDYIRTRAQQARRPVRLSVTTNGTFLTQPVIDFLKDEDVGVCVSLDGPEHIHNVNRRYRNDGGTFSEVVANLRETLEQLERVQTNAVYGPETLSALPETVSFLLDLGVSAVHLNPDICASWTSEVLPTLRSAYMQVARQYVERYRGGEEVAVNLIDSKLLLFLKGGYAAEDMCGMGETEWGFAPSGNIYPCERFIEEDDGATFCLGNVHTGLEPMLRCALLEHRDRRNDTCNSCALLKYCMNWCGCTNYHMTSHIGTTSSMTCESEKAAIGAARYVLLALHESDNELFVDHLMRYARDGRHPRDVRDPGGTRGQGCHFQNGH